MMYNKYIIFINQNTKYYEYYKEKSTFDNIQLVYIEAKNFWLKNKFLHNNKSSILHSYTVIHMYIKL